MRKIADRIKNNKGSITLFVLIAMIFFLIFALTMYVQINSKKSAQMKEIEKIQEEYNSTNIDEIYDNNEGNTDGEISIILYTMDGEVYDLSQWTNQNLKLKINYPDDVNEEDRFYYKDGVKIKYTENEIIEENCVISVEYDTGRESVKITRIDKQSATVIYDKNGDEYILGEGENTKNISTKIIADDGYGSGVKTIEYQISDSPNMPSQDDKSWKTTENSQIVEETKTGGIYYVYVKTTDNVGNIGIYKSKPFKVSYQVIYDINGEKGGPTNQIKTHGVNLILSLEKPTKDGYTFIGWGIEKDTDKVMYRPGETYSENATRRLYAIYTKEITATFNYYNGEVKTIVLKGTANNDDTSVDIVAPNLENTTKDGITYNARGWSTNTSGNATIDVNPGDNVTLSTNTTYYASYSKPVTLSYEANGGNEAPENQNENTYLNYKGAITPANITISSTKPTRTGWTFENWNIASDGEGTSYMPGDNIEITTNCTLYAIWKDATPPTVTLSPNGGTTLIPPTGTAIISTKLTATDNESGLKTLQYAWSTSSTSEPRSWTNFTNGQTVSKSDISSVGTYYLWTNVIDNEGNRATNVKISNVFIVKPASGTEYKITITPDKTDWTNQDVIGTVVYGTALTNNRKAGFGKTLEQAKNSATTGNASRVTATENGCIYAEASDMAGNKVSEYINVTNIDKTSPEIINTTKGTDNFPDSTFKSGLNGIDVYNNNNNGQVKINRVNASSDIPTDSGYMLEIKTTGSSTSPGRGGYVQWLNVQSNHVYRHRIIAKIPKGYKIQRAANACGNNATHTWLTSQEGTGKWELYEYETDCGSSGTFQTMGHIYIDKTTATSDIVTWQVAYSNIIDLNGGPAIFRLGDVAFNSGLNSAVAYNNSNSGKVTLNRVAKSSDSPSTSTHMLEIKTTGSPTSPGLGGFYQMIDSGANQVFRHRIIAKIPKGYKIMCASNSCGDGAVFSWLTPQEGTGEWKVYEYEVICGSTGTFSTFGYIYLDKIASSSPTNVTWYVQYSSVINTSKYLNKGTMKINAKDDSSGIYKYGYSSSATVEPTNYMTNNPKKNVAIVDLKISDYNNEYLWLKDVAGNTKVIRTKHKTPPQISSQPKNITVNSGSTASFSVSVTTGYPEKLSYQWQYRPNSSSGWYDGGSATNGDYSNTKKEVNVSSAVNGYQYRCKISNGVYTIYTNIATLTVNEVAHTCNTNGYCTSIHSSGVSWLCKCGSYHTTHRHAMCTICGKKSPVSWWKCPNYPEGVPMPCK